MTLNTAVADEEDEVRNFVVVDDFGRRTTFTGEKLISESTDTTSNTKPQWLEIVVWRTQAGSFVVQRTTHYRIRHLRELCPRADGYDLIPSTEIDVYPCPVCNRSGVLADGYAQSSRISVDVYHVPEDLIASFKVDSRFNNLAKSILADLAEQDDRVDSKWSVVHVP